MRTASLVVVRPLNWVCSFTLQPESDLRTELMMLLLARTSGLDGDEVRGICLPVFVVAQGLIDTVGPASSASSSSQDQLRVPEQVTAELDRR